MSATIIDGKAYAEKILDQIRNPTIKLTGKPSLTVIQVGDDPASSIYVSKKRQTAESVGFKFNLIHLPGETTTAELEIQMRLCNDDPSLHGYIVQLPLPRQINPEIVATTMNPDKDVDGVSVINMGLLLRGKPEIIPATPLGILFLLAGQNPVICTRSKHVTIVGRSTIVGRPMAAALLMTGFMGDATVTIAHSLTPNLREACHQADILIVAIGQPKLITSDFVKPGAVVIDVGINRVNGKLCGDVDFESVKEVASAITPVPGGVGPMTVAALMHNTFIVASLAMTR